MQRIPIPFKIFAVLATVTAVRMICYGRFPNSIEFDCCMTVSRCCCMESGPRHLMACGGDREVLCSSFCGKETHIRIEKSVEIRTAGHLYSAAAFLYGSICAFGKVEVTVESHGVLVVRIIAVANILEKNRVSCCGEDTAVSIVLNIVTPNSIQGHTGINIVDIMVSSTDTLTRSGVISCIPFDENSLSAVALCTAAGIESVLCSDGIFVGEKGKILTACLGESNTVTEATLAGLESYGIGGGVGVSLFPNRSKGMDS